MPTVINTTGTAFKISTRKLKGLWEDHHDLFSLIFKQSKKRSKFFISGEKNANRSFNQFWRAGVGGWLVVVRSMLKVMDAVGSSLRKTK